MPSSAARGMSLRSDARTSSHGGCASTAGVGVTDAYTRNPASDGTARWARSSSSERSCKRAGSRATSTDTESPAASIASNAAVTLRSVEVT